MATLMYGYGAGAPPRSPRTSCARRHRPRPALRDDLRRLRRRAREPRGPPRRTPKTRTRRGRADRPEGLNEYGDERRRCTREKPLFDETTGRTTDCSSTSRAGTPTARGRGASPSTPSRTRPGRRRHDDENAPRGTPGWGLQPAIQTMDYRPLPGGYGFGLQLASWIEAKMAEDASANADRRLRAPRALACSRRRAASSSHSPAHGAPSPRADARYPAPGGYGFGWHAREMDRREDGWDEAAEGGAEGGAEGAAPALAGRRICDGFRLKRARSRSGKRRPDVARETNRRASSERASE